MQGRQNFKTIHENVSDESRFVCNIGLVGSELKLRKHGLSCLVSVVCAAL